MATSIHDITEIAADKLHEVMGANDGFHNGELFLAELEFSKKNNGGNLIKFDTNAGIFGQFTDQFKHLLPEIDEKYGIKWLEAQAENG